ncbi:MAG: FAD-dependent oxidoreductase [Paracoccaceae bacterium]
MLKLKSGTRGVKEIIGTIRSKEELKINEPSNLEIAIIGAGISGLSSALLLKQQGYNVMVFEKDKSIRSEGAGIQITSNGLFVLKKLGLSGQAAKAGLKPKNLCLFDENDFKSIGSLEILDRLKRRYGRSFITLQRSLLVRMLFEKVKEKKIQVHFGSKALPLVKKDTENVYIVYKGKKIEKDLIVVADGVGSTWKKTIFREIKTRSVSQSAYRFLLSNKKLPAIFTKNNINLFLGKGRHFVTYPTGNNGMINFVFCKRESGHMINHWKEKVTKQEFLKDFELNKVLKTSLPDVKKIYRWPVVESEIPLTLHKKNVVMVGDAAHGMLPYMAQGANKALEDSLGLATCIAEVPLDLKKGLNNYSKKRIRRIYKLDRVSRYNEKVYHLEQNGLRSIFFTLLRCITSLFPNFFFKRLDWIYNYKG